MQNTFYKPLTPSFRGIKKDRRESSKGESKMKIGDKVLLPKLPGEYQPRRKGTVVAKTDYFWLIQMEKGYKESVLFMDEKEVKVL